MKFKINLLNELRQAKAMKDRDTESLSFASRLKKTKTKTTTSVIKTRKTSILKKRPLAVMLSALMILTILIGTFIIVPPIINGGNLLDFFSNFDRFTYFGEITIEGGGTISDGWQTANMAFKSVIESLSYAIIGLTIGITFSIPTALIASNNIVNSKGVNTFTKTLVTITRAMPIIMVAQILGKPFVYKDIASLFILSLFVWSTFTKWVYEDIEDIDSTKIKSMKVTGISNTQVIKNVVIPDVSTKLMSSAFYMLEITFRFTAALGLFGLGGIGHMFTILKFDNYTHWGHLLLTILIFVSSVIVLSIISKLFQRYVINYKTKRSIFGFNEDKKLQTKILDENLKNKDLSSITRKKPVLHKYLMSIFAISLLTFSVYELTTASYATNPIDLADFKLAIEGLFSPDWSAFTGDINSNPLYLLIDSLAIVFGTFFLATILAIPLGIFSSKRIAPSWVADTLEIFNSFLRAVPSFMFVTMTLLFSNPAFAAVLGMGMSSAGNLAERLKISLDTLPESQGKTITATGGSKFDKLWGGMLPQVLPAFIGRAMFILELSFKNLLILSAFGISDFAIVFNNSIAQGSANYELASTFFMVFIATTLIIEGFTQWTRAKLNAPTKLFSKQFVLKRSLLNFNLGLNIFVNKWIYQSFGKEEKTLKINKENFEIVTEIDKLDLIQSVYNRELESWIIEEDTHE